MHTTEAQTVAAGHSADIDPARWQAGLEELRGRVAGRFGRVEPRRRARAFGARAAGGPAAQALLDAGRARPGTLLRMGWEHLLARAVWDHGGVRADVRAWLVEHPGDPQAVLVVNETGDLKKGTRPSGSSARTPDRRPLEHAPVAVVLVAAGQAGHAVIDRELYVPRRWIADHERRATAGVPEQVGFATKPELARRMLARALAAEVPVAWVTGDEVYGISPSLRAWLETHRLSFVLAVWCTEALQPLAGPLTPTKLLAAGVPPERWLRLNAGDGAKGCRWYAWTRVALSTAGVPEGWGRWLLVRRNLRSGELAFYVCAGPAGLPLVAVVKVAGCRWRVEESFQGEGALSLAVVLRGGGWAASPPAAPTPAAPSCRAPGTTPST